MIPLVSIIIPVYNSEKYLEETIYSALNQTYKNIEIIVIDDGSADGSPAILKTFESEKLKVFYQDNKGAAAARNRGLTEAKGEYIQYLDADDLLSPGKIEEQIIILQNNPGYLCTGATIHFFSGEDYCKKEVDYSWMSENLIEPTDFLIKLYGDNLVGSNNGGIVALHSWLCPRSILNKAGEWNEELSVDDDGEYFCRVILASKGVIYTANGVNYYRKHTQHQSLSAQRNMRAFKSIITAVDLKYKHLYQAKGSKEIPNKLFARYYWETGVAAYPKYKSISTYCITKAKEMGYAGPKYKAGPVSTFLSKIIGWRIVRILTYLKYRI